MGRFFPYLGGKTALIPRLLKLIPAHDIYVEVFGGSAELLFAKPRSRTEVYNDINGDLVNLFMVTRDHVDALMERLDWLLQSREIHETWKRELKAGRVPMDPIERAARYYYILCTQFAGKMWGGWAYAKIGRRYWGDYRVKRLRGIHRRLQGVHIEHSDFRKILDTWDSPNTFFFLDPPYLDTTGYGHDFTQKDHEDLADKLSRVEGKWLLTVGDHHLMHRLYASYLIEKAQVTLASEKVEAGRDRKGFCNLIIRNYELNDPAQTVLGYYLLEATSEPRTREDDP